MNKIIIMVGNVGSGKSTFIKEQMSDFVRISQDVLGSKEECIKQMRQALTEGKSVVVDRVNFNKKQRKTWIDIAKEFKIEPNAVYLEVPNDICFKRICERKGHETISEQMPEDKKFDIIYNFSKMMEIPSLDEGFRSIMMARNYD